MLRFLLARYVRGPRKPNIQKNPEIPDTWRKKTECTPLHSPLGINKHTEGVCEVSGSNSEKRRELLMSKNIFFSDGIPEPARMPSTSAHNRMTTVRPCLTRNVDQHEFPINSKSKA